MSRQNILIIVCAVFTIALVLWFVTPSREERARAQLDTAYKIEKSGEFDHAVTEYEMIIREYSDTDAAKRAVEYIDRIRQHQERKLVQEEKKTLDRIVLVMNGYREMMGSIPTSIQQLDGGEYMFDSNYMAEIVPEGSTCYLRFEPETASFTVFSVRENTDRVVMSDSDGQARVISRTELEREISRDGLERTVKGGMVFLQPASG